jgi:hypothetical protein
VEAWADGSAWKRKFLAKNPSSVYVEVQNYFVKSLSGWTAADGPASRTHLRAAQAALQGMDVVLLTEHMRASNSSDLLEHLFGHPRHPGAAGGAGLLLLQRESNKADAAEVRRLEALLASDKVRDESMSLCLCVSLSLSLCLSLSLWLAVLTELSGAGGGLGSSAGPQPAGPGALVLR